MRVADLGRAQEFYERLFGRPPELVPNDHEAAWQLHPGAWMVLIADGGGAGGAQHTLIVGELDGLLEEISARGVAPGPVEAVGAGMRQSVVVDPDGNRWKLAARASPA